jgi:hypothetical protein
MADADYEAAAHFWGRVSQDLNIEIVAPFELGLRDRAHIKALALVKNFGRINGMLILEDYAAAQPYVSEIINKGYGYTSNFRGSVDSYNRESIIEILRDWDWSGPEEPRPGWL